MKKEEGIVLPIIIAVLMVLFFVAVWYLVYTQYPGEKQPACTMEAKICPDGSAVGRTGPNCEFAACPKIKGLTYINDEYGFELILPESWKGYTTEKQIWEGRIVDTGEQKYSGPIVLIKNPKTTLEQMWQDIPIMVFTPDVWNMVSGPQATVAVSAAPIGPEKIGENKKYIFATPPRWYGFTDAIGWEEAVEIVKTFKPYK